MFELPESLGELSVEALNELLAAAREEARGITALLADASTAADADLDRLESLANAIDTLANEVVARNAAEADDVARAERAAALAARVTVEDVEEVLEVVEAEVVEPVVASVPVVKAPAKAPLSKAPVLLPAKKNGSLVASANVNGAISNVAEAVPHLIRAWDGLAGSQNGTQRDVFSITTAMDPRLVANGRNDAEVVAYAVDQSRLANGQGLLAAGGWCAPPEQRYDICDLSSLSGILDLPTISVPRGSLSYFRELDYRTTCQEAAAGFACYTNAELEALPPLVKPCVEVPCKDPVTFELGACSFCVRAGVLQRRAFPELVEAWFSQALKCYQHYLNAKHIAEIVALASANTVVIPGSFGAIVPFLDALDLQATDLRYDHGMADNAVVEGFAPWWLPVVFRADAAKRQFGADYNLTKSQINSYLAARNIRLQWVEDYIDAPFAGVAAVTALPTTVDVVLYPAGAYLNASDNILRVGALQDSTLLTTNREQLLFVETAEGIVPACGNGRVVTIPLCASGETAGPVDPIGTNTCG